MSHSQTDRRDSTAFEMLETRRLLAAAIEVLDTSGNYVNPAAGAVTTFNLGNGVHVRASSSTLTTHSPTLSRYQWEFEDPTASFDLEAQDDFIKLPGFNAAHYFNTANPEDNPTYTVKLTVTDPSNNVFTDTVEVDINSQTWSKTLYVAASGGNDDVSNPGTSAGSPLATVGRAMALVNQDNVRVLLRRGETHNVAANPQTIARNNVHVTSDASFTTGTGADPTVMWTPTNNASGTVFDVAATARNVTFSRFKVSSAVSTPSSGGTMYRPDAFRPGGKNTVIKDVTFDHVKSFIETTGPKQVEGLLVQNATAVDNESTDRNGVYGDIGGGYVLLGNTFRDSRIEHNIRTYSDRVLAYKNILENTTNGTTSGLNKSVSTLRTNGGSYIYWANNDVNGGVSSIGQLSDESNSHPDDEPVRYVVSENNVFKQTPYFYNDLVQQAIDVSSGAEYVMLRNNYIEASNRPGIVVKTYEGINYGGIIDHRYAKDIKIINNTVDNWNAGAPYDGKHGKFLRVMAGPTRMVGGVDVSLDIVTLRNNLYVAPELTPGSGETAVIFSTGSSDLKHFASIGDNVWADRGSANTSSQAPGGIMFVGQSWAESFPEGYKTSAEWNSFPEVGTDTFHTLSGAAWDRPNRKPTTSAADVAKPYAGVFTDLNGDDRDPSAANWTAGAVERNPVQPPAGDNEPYLGTPFPVGSTPVTIQAEVFDLGGEGVAYHDSDTVNSGESPNPPTFRTTEAVDIKTTSDTGGGHRVNGTLAGEWLEYTIDVQQAGSYTLDTRVAAFDPGATLHIEIDGVNVTGSIAVPDTNSYNAMQTISRTIDLTTGEHILRLVFDTNTSTNSDAGTVNWMKLTAAQYRESSGRLVIRGTSGNDTISVAANVSNTDVTINGNTESYATSTLTGVLLDVANLGGNDAMTANAAATLPVTLSGSAAGDTLTANGGTVTLDGTEHLDALTIGSGASVKLPANGSHYLFTKGLSIASGGELDLFDNDLLWDYTGADVYQSVFDWVNTGIATGNSGLTSSTAEAAGDTVLAPANSGAHGVTSWLGQSIDTTTLIVKYTYYGDGNLDGKVTSDDYVPIDINAGTGTTWIEGDYNLDRLVTSDDYVVVDANLGKGVSNPL